MNLTSRKFCERLVEVNGDGSKLPNGITTDSLLVSLPDNMKIEDFIDCTSVVSLPSGLHVEGDLWLHNCASLTSLPDDLQVDGRLWLAGCTSLVLSDEQTTKWKEKM